ncbi:hypothetical protein HQP04_03180 [Rhodococcus fascians]|jgi:hypothetical protein|nr:hypothetical protein [Rhodococcus fascians]MBY4021010.1 hypothetical protein [Rhodococcus fascians]
MFAAVLFGWFCQTYGTFTWFLDPPPRIMMNDRQYTPENFAASTDLPTATGFDWEVVGHMWPLGYEIYGDRGYETSMELVLRWRDGKFHRYGIKGGP